MSINAYLKELVKLYDKSRDATVGWEGVNGSAKIYSLKRNAIIKSAGPYDKTEILGYRVINAGSGSWRLIFVDGEDITVESPAFKAGETYNEHLKSISVGINGTAILYIA